jgi:PAS domain S-box-containing protein/putative nucleotidyltransferase with HDIG domain
MMGLNYRKYTDEENAKNFFQTYNKVYATGEPAEAFDWQMIRKDGVKIYVEESISLKKDSAGKITGFSGIVRDVTERRRAEALLKQSEEKYRTILENIEDGYYEVDIAGNFTFFNNSLCRIIGYSPEEMTGMNYRKYTDKENSKKLFQAYNKVYASGESAKGFDWQIIRKDGTKRYVEASVSLLKDSSGKLTGCGGIVRDITERKQTEDLIKQSEEQYRLLADHIKDYVWLMDLNLKWTYISPSGEKLLGYTLEEIQQLLLNDLLTEISLQTAINTFSTELSRELAAPRPPSYSIPLELECRSKNGKTLWIDCTLSFIRDDNGKPVSILGEGRDISERKKMEEDLKKSEEQYRLLANNITEHVWLMDLKSIKTVYVSPSVEKMYGYALDEIRNLSLREILTEEYFKKMVDTFKTELPKAFAAPPPSVHKYSLEMQARHKSGRLLWIDSTLSFIRDEKGNPSLILGETIDITERKQAEEKLQHTLNSLRKAVGTTIQVLVSALESRDPYTAGHQSRSADLARTIATEMGLDQDRIEGIRMAGIIHDIGKLAIPAEILSKPSKLTNVEFSLIKEHSKIGYEMLKDVESPWPLAQIVHQHHERMDGTGYPNKLKGDEIILEARIMAVADVVEAIASHRPYRASLGIEAALEEIRKNKGILYDDVVADACLRIFWEKGYHLP